MGKLARSRLLYTEHCVKLRAMETPGPSAGDVLAQPTRARLFELLQELKRETSTEELAERARAARQRGPAPAGAPSRGRAGRATQTTPWARAPSRSVVGRRRRQPRWRAPARLRRPCRLAGQRHPGRARAPAPGRANRPRDRPRAGADRHRRLGSGLRAGSERARLSAATRARPGRRVCCRLGNCPYKEAVRDNQAVVCTLHEGITAGLLEQLVARRRG